MRRTPPPPPPPPYEKGISCGARPGRDLINTNKERRGNPPRKRKKESHEENRNPAAFNIRSRRASLNFVGGGGGGGRGAFDRFCAMVFGLVSHSCERGKMGL